MYKVLLVDDEPMALEVLKYVIDWEKLGFSVCGACSGGREAAEVIEKYEPELVVTDIKMPVMDGLDLIRHAREKGKKNIKFVVISGFGEFEYAKKAMQYSVRYYLQKPVVEEEIYEIILEIKKEMDKQRRDKESAERDLTAAVNAVLSNLIRGNVKEEFLEYLKVIMDEEDLLNSWNCIVIELEAQEEAGIKDIRQKVGEAIDRVVGNDHNTFVLEHGLYRYVILASLNDEEAHENKINSIAGRIYEGILTVLSSGFTMAVGEKVLGIEAINHSYSTAEAALSHRFYRGLNSLIPFEEVRNKSFKFEFNELFMSDKVLEAVEEVDIGKIKDTIDTSFSYFQSHNLDPNIVIMFTSNMIDKVNKLLYQSENRTRRFMYNHTIRELKGHERTMSELKKFFEDFCLYCCEHLKKTQHRGEESNMAKIEAFISENYKRNITIRELADKVYMHPAYLGQLFIRKFKVSFNEYIHKLRIEEAIRLMKTTNLKNHEIAEEVGYSSYNGFLQKFQKYTGMKPMEFRNDIH
ncbi:response regulator [Clostridium thermarum]|uniref:response regulator n=1 Tax=Clostridium thermarum TaxID=1716543 RepID=UPI0013D47F87|nr:response regulator [Clostridium thermarum]